MRDNPPVHVIVLNWNNAADTIECLHSLEQTDYQPLNRLVVDNGSMNGSVDVIREAFPGIELMELDTNYGYARGNNMGIQHAIEAGAEYVLILNNDTCVEASMLAQLVSIAESNTDIGMIGPAMYCYGTNSTIFALGSTVNWKLGETIHRGIFQPATEFSDLYKPEPVDFIPGCGVLVSRKFIETVGFLDPTYFLNYEDADWGIRGKRLGFEIWFVPQAKMWHKVSATLGKASPANTYYMTRNALLFFWRRSPPGYRWIAVLVILLRTLRSILAWTVRPKYRNPEFKALRSANIQALRDFSAGRFGPLPEDTVIR
ncbi:MAG: glycosyltransferase family 2 protein [Chloroflexota bacterium]|nr:MAG: glycosyltransferase family 2 protein [Chloroflexota bacterium]